MAYPASSKKKVESNTPKSPASMERSAGAKKTLAKKSVATTTRVKSVMAKSSSLPVNLADIKKIIQELLRKELA